MTTTNNENETKLTFNQWTNRLFEQSEFSRDVLASKAVQAILRSDYEAGRAPAAALENLRSFFWQQ